MKRILTIPILVSLAFSSMIVVKTNYYDLAKYNAAQLSAILLTDDLSSLDEASLGKLTTYFKENILNTDANYGDTYFDENGIKQKYFYHIYNNLPAFVRSEERHTGYYNNANKSTLNDKLLAYSIYRLDRNPENIKLLFNHFKPLLPKLLSKEDYVTIGADKAINSLINTYGFITGLDNYRNNIDSVCYFVDTLTGMQMGLEFTLFENTAYGHSIYTDYNIYDEYLKISEYDAANRDDDETMWAFSFWVRRHKENNMAAVFKIVKEINNLYRGGRRLNQKN